MSFEVCYTKRMTYTPSALDKLSSKKQLSIVLIVIITIAAISGAYFFFNPYKELKEISRNDVITRINNCELKNIETRTYKSNNATSQVIVEFKDSTRFITEKGLTKEFFEPYIKASNCSK